MLTYRIAFCLLFLEVFLTHLIANDAQKQKKNEKPKPSTQKACRLEMIANGNSHLFNTSNMVRYTCQGNYKIYGVKITGCRKNGKLLHPPPVCVAPGCPKIPIPIDGPLKTYDPPNKPKGAVIEFNCASGFELLGHPSIYCNKTDWSGQPPKCIAMRGSTTTEVIDVQKPVINFTVTYNQPTEKVTTNDKSVKSTTPSYPAVDEILTTEHDETSLSVTEEKVKESATSPGMILSVETKTPLPTMFTEVPSSLEESDLPSSTTIKAELIQSVDSGDLNSHSTLKVEESTSPSPVQDFVSFPGENTESDSVRSNTIDGVTRGLSGELAETESDSTSEVIHEDEETKRPEIRATETQDLSPEKTFEEVEEKVSESDHGTTSQELLTTTDSVVSVVKTHPFSSDMVPEKDRTLETLTFSSARLEEESKDGEEEIHTITLDSPQVLINDPKTRTTSEQRSMFSFSPSFMEEREDVTVPEHDFNVAESDAEGPIIVTHFHDEEEYGRDPETTIPQSSSDYTSTERQGHESSSDEVLRTEKTRTRGNETGRLRLVLTSFLTTYVPPLNPSSSKSIPKSAPFDSPPNMTSKDRVSVALIVVIIAVVIVLVALLFILVKTLKPNCPLRPKTCEEHGAVPYSAQVEETNDVALKDVTSVSDNNSCTRF